MVLVEGPSVPGLTGGSPPVVDYQVPLDAYFVLTAVLGGFGAFDLVDATTGEVLVSEHLVPQLVSWLSATEDIGIVFRPGAQVGWQAHSGPVTLPFRLLEGYLVHHNKLASQ